MSIAQNNCIISHYAFNGNASDSVGANHGTVYGATLTQDRFGNANSAYQFSASGNHYISIPASPFLRTNYSYSVWIKPTSLPGSGSAVIFLSVGSNYDQNMQIENNQNNGTLGNLTGFTLTAYNSNGSGTSRGGVASGTLPSTNTWYHVVCTRDSNYYKVYVNGCLVSTSSNYGNNLPYYGTGGYSATIGCRRNGSRYFTGVLDDVSIYSCALNPVEISRLYHDYKPLKVSSDTTICLNDFKPFKLKAEKGYCTYRWIEISNRTSTLGRDSHLNINITSSKTFRVFVNTGDSATVKVIINKNPVLNLGNDTMICGPFEKILDAGQGMLHYNWKGFTDTGRYFPVNSGGTYFAEITDSNNCRSADTVNITQHSLPVVLLGRDTFYCNRFIAVLNAGNQGSNHKWNTGDSTESILINKGGEYSVEVTDSFGCRQTDTILIDNPEIKADFTSPDSVSCFKGNLFTLENISKSTEDGIIESVWFINGSTRYDTGIFKISFLDTGMNEVKLVVTSINGCSDTAMKYFMVFPNSELKFEINRKSQCIPDNLFRITDNSVYPGGKIVRRSWDFGDGEIIHDTSDYSKKYYVDGNFIITLTSISEHGCKDTISEKVIVNPGPVSEFDINNPVQCFKGHSFTLLNKSAVSKGNIIRSYWNMGNGNFDSVDNVLNYKYLRENSFIVSLIVSTDSGCMDTAFYTLKTLAQPYALINIPEDTSCWNGLPINIYNNSYINSGYFSVSWDFGDGSSDTAFYASKLYANSTSTYIIRYIINAENGCNDTSTLQVHLKESPVAAIEIKDSIQCFRNHLFEFTNNSSYRQFNNLQFKWTYGNGNVSTGKDPVKAVYNDTGVFQVTLYATDSISACSDTALSFLTILPNAIPDFTVNRDTQCLIGNLFAFVNTSQPKPDELNYKWIFGAGAQSLEINPEKQYDSAGSYQVVLLSVTNAGCYDTIRKWVNILRHPDAMFSVNDSIQCQSAQLFDFYNETEFHEGNVTFNWMLEDINVSSDTNITNIVFDSDGPHKVTLISSSEMGCTDTASRTVYVEANNNVRIAVSKDTQCLKGNLFNFSFSAADSSTAYSGGKWDFSDGKHDSGLTVSHKFITAGQYQVRLALTSIQNCPDTGSTTLLVLPHPVTSFYADTACFPEPALFSNRTVSSGYSNLKYKWDFGDGTHDTATNPIHRYSYPGSFSVSLISIDEYQCSDTLMLIKAAIIVNKPKADFTFMYLAEVDFNTYKYQFINTSSNDATVFEWLTSDGQSSPEENTEFVFYDTSSRIIRLVVKNQDGCTDTTILNTGRILSEFRFFLPDAFTPDGNYINDIFSPSGSPYVKRYIMEIFNRWGEKVFISNDYSKGWDGSYNGSQCPEGVYLVRVSLFPLSGGIKTYAKTITLLR